MVFRCSEPGQSSYAEKIWSDDIRNGAPWATALNFEKRPMRWADGGEDKMNANNYAIRLFIVPLDVLPPDEDIIEMGTFICDNLNAHPSNYCKVEVSKQNFFWIKTPTTWQHVISTASCLERIYAAVGQPVSGGWWSTNEELVKSYFAPGSINESLARKLYAPPYMLAGHTTVDLVDTEQEEGEEGEEEEEEEEEEESPARDKMGVAMTVDPFADDSD